LILSKLGKIDNLVEQSINVEGELLDDLDSWLSQNVSRLKTLQLKYKYA
jgi:hypothetical protein